MEGWDRKTPLELRVIRLRIEATQDFADGNERLQTLKRPRADRNVHDFRRRCR
jgi:hypothetical protein